MFYTFRQNNSGGAFALTDDLTRFVIIEATSKEQACDKLIALGAYFDGCEMGRDCSCCGDRWNTCCDESETPLVSGRAADQYGNGEWEHRWMKPSREIVIHYEDGKKEWF